MNMAGGKADNPIMVSGRPLADKLKLGHWPIQAFLTQRPCSSGCQ